MDAEPRIPRTRLELAESIAAAITAIAAFFRLPLTVTLHGQSHSYNALLLATRLDARRFQVVTLEPLLLRAEDFGLLPGLESLRKFAGLKSINPSVPVSAVLIFTAR